MRREAPKRLKFAGTSVKIGASISTLGFFFRVCYAVLIIRNSKTVLKDRS